MGCLFCKIGRKELPAEIVYEDDRTTAFLDVRPRAAGHTMVIPKRHAETILDLPDEEIEPLFRAVKEVAARLVEVLRAKGITIGVNQGRVAGQEIDHLHVHLLPRFEDDRGGSVQSVVNHPPQESLAEIARKIRKSQQTND